MKMFLGQSEKSPLGGWAEQKAHSVEHPHEQWLTSWSTLPSEL